MLSKKTIKHPWVDGRSGVLDCCIRNVVYLSQNFSEYFGLTFNETINIHRMKPAVGRDIGQGLPLVVLQLVSHDVGNVTCPKLVDKGRGTLPRYSENFNQVSWEVNMSNRIKHIHCVYQHVQNRQIWWFLVTGFVLQYETCTLSSL